MKFYHLFALVLISSTALPVFAAENPLGELWSIPHITKVKACTQVKKTAQYRFVYHVCNESTNLLNFIFKRERYVFSEERSKKMSQAECEEFRTAMLNKIEYDTQGDVFDPCAIVPDASVPNDSF